MTDKPRMFQNPLSIRGRICRLEYCFSCLIYIACHTVVVFLFEKYDETQIMLDFLIFLLLPPFYFLIVQGIKRCHDRNNSGWYQLIPFYGFWMLFTKSDYGENEYGLNPEGEGDEEIINNIGTGDQ